MESKGNLAYRLETSEKDLAAFSQVNRYAICGTFSFYLRIKYPLIMLFVPSNLLETVRLTKNRPGFSL